MNTLELYMDQEKMYSFEGSRGVRNIEKIVGVLGYSNLQAFLEDNSGAVEAMLGFVQEWAERNSEWKEALQAELFEELGPLTSAGGFYDVGNMTDDEIRRAGHE